MKKIMQMVLITLTFVSATSVVATEVEVENPLAIASQYRKYNLLPEVEDSSSKLKENGNLESLPF